jgi:hypothetical protein
VRPPVQGGDEGDFHILVHRNRQTTPSRDNLADAPHASLFPGLPLCGVMPPPSTVAPIPNRMQRLNGAAACVPLSEEIATMLPVNFAEF